MALGMTLATVRQQQGRTRKWVAKQAGITVGTLRYIEIEQTKNPGILHILGIARALGLTLETIVQAATEEDGS